MWVQQRHHVNRPMNQAKPMSGALQWRACQSSPVAVTAKAQAWPSAPAYSARVNLGC
jgi:hypothetical protein